MRKTLLSLTAVAGLLAAGIATSAVAAPVGVTVAPAAASMVQPVAYYGGYHGRRAAHWHRSRFVRHEYHHWVRRR